jgi:hypothetical protein
MPRDKILGFLVKRCSYLLVLLGVSIYGYMQRHSPRQPDPASGHVYAVVAPRSRHTVRHILYLTSAERSLYHASFLAICAGIAGILGHVAIMLKERPATT